MSGFQAKRKMALSRMSDEVSQSPREEDWGLNRASGWRLTFNWIPRQCFISNKDLWLKKSYIGTHVITGPGSDVVDYYYVDKYEFMKWNLKGRI